MPWISFRNLPGLTVLSLPNQPLLNEPGKLSTILRFFVIDSMAYSSIEKQLRSVKPDYIEILPALMPKVVSRICRIFKVPVITGGLISDKEDVVSMLNAGAVCISSTNPDVWFL